MSRPMLLDLCCGEGGAARGYADAGFEVVGVDIRPQPRYPFPFIEADALEVLRDYAFLAGFAAIHASWPCQRYSPLAALPSTKDASEHLDLIAPGRELLLVSGKTWVMENVMTAPLDRSRSIRLCAEMFGLRAIRHRRFEPSPGLTLTAPPHVLPHKARTATSRRRERWAQGWHVSITGDVGTYVGPEAMGIDWMTGNGLCEAIPPAYTRFIGEQLLAHLAADPRPGPGPKPGGPTGPQPTHPPSMPPPAPVPAPSSFTVPSVCEPSGHGAPSGTRAAQPYLRGAGCVAHQTPAVAFRGVGGGG